MAPSAVPISRTVWAAAGSRNGFEKMSFTTIGRVTGNDVIIMSSEVISRPGRSEQLTSRMMVGVAMEALMIKKRDTANSVRHMI